MDWHVRVEAAIERVEAGQPLAYLALTRSSVVAASLLPYMTRHPRLRFALKPLPDGKVAMMIIRKAYDDVTRRR